MEQKRRHSAKEVQKRRKRIRILLILAAVLLLLLGAVYAVFRHYYGKSNYIKDADVTRFDEEDLKDVDVDDEIGDLSDDEVNALQSEAAEIVGEIDHVEGNVYNLLLIGVDRRDRSWYGNSDSMILISVNRDTKTIHMTSFMRDLYADIPGIGVKKLNAACAYGGGPLLVQTIEENYRISIDNYASVDFSSMMDIIDRIGGVELSITDAEAESANGSIQEMCGLRGENPESHYFHGGGTYLMDGCQAVAYARIRHVGNADYQRTERQRIVLGKIMEKAKTLSVSELNAVADAVLPLVTHNLSQTDVLSLISELPSLLSYDRVTSRVPYDGLYGSQGTMLVPDFAATIQRLQTEIYGTTTVE